MDGVPIAPTWFVLPLAAIAMILQAGYLLALRELPRGRMPPSRRRIRVAIGWLSLFAIPISAYGFGIATTRDPGTFAMVWMVIIALIAMILMLAVLDTINTMRLHRNENDRLHKDFRTALRSDIDGHQRKKRGSK